MGTAKVTFDPTVTDWLLVLLNLALVMVAVAAAWVALRHRNVAALQSLRELESRMNEPGYLISRHSVAHAFAAGEMPNAVELNNALGGYEFVAFAAQQRWINMELCWTIFGDEILAYWCAYEPEIRSRRGKQPAYLEHLGWLVTRFERLNRKKGINWVEGKPGRDDILATFREIWGERLEKPEYEPASSAQIPAAD